MVVYFWSFLGKSVIEDGYPWPNSQSNNEDRKRVNVPFLLELPESSVELGNLPLSFLYIFCCSWNCFLRTSYFCINIMFFFHNRPNENPYWRWMIICVPSKVQLTVEQTAIDCLPFSVSPDICSQKEQHLLFSKNIGFFT